MVEGGEGVSGGNGGGLLVKCPWRLGVDGGRGGVFVWNDKGV